MTILRALLSRIGYFPVSIEAYEIERQKLTQAINASDPTKLPYLLCYASKQSLAWMKSPKNFKSPYDTIQNYLLIGTALS